MFKMKYRKTPLTDFVSIMISVLLLSLVNFFKNQPVHPLSYLVAGIVISIFYICMNMIFSTRYKK